MSKAPWMALVYGYVVCLVAVVTFIVSASSFVDAMFDRANPINSREGMFGPGGAQLTSFEAFRASYMERAPMRTRPAAEPAPSDTLSTAELRARYEALRADRITQMSHVALQRLVKHSLLMLLAIVLFATHWRWVRGQRESTEPA
jgi:hypothetical protein